MRRKPGERVRGPYAHTKGFVCQVIEPLPEGKSRTRYHYFTTREDAQEFRNRIESEITRAATTVGEALDEYEKHLKAKGNKDRSRKETLRRLKKFFPSHGLLLDLLTQRTCEKYYRDLVDRGLAADSHRNYLAEARTFAAWCVKQRWLGASPLASIAGVGRRSSRKKQLRIDEARKWDAFAIAAAREGSDGALAALLTLWLGMRCSEIVNLRVRDVDDDARVLWVAASKTAAGVRRLDVPEALGELLKEHVRGLRGDVLLFRGSKGKRDRAYPRLAVQEICRMVDVPVITAHGMRGLHTTLSVRAGATPELVAASLGHESFRTTQESYIAPGTVEEMAKERGMRVLKGGR